MSHEGCATKHSTHGGADTNSDTVITTPAVTSCDFVEITKPSLDAKVVTDPAAHSGGV